MAEARLATAQKEHREKKSKKVDPSNARMAFGQAAALHQQQPGDNLSLKRRTKQYGREVATAVLKSWPELAETEIRRITPAACRERASRYAKTMSPTRYNAALSLVRHVINVAIESRVIYLNPAANLDRKSLRAERLELPTRAQFAAFIAKMRAAHSCDSQSCADLAEGLAFTGCRIGESWHIEWRDLDFVGGEILVKGDPGEGPKNSETRRVPMILGATVLFQRMRKQRLEEPGREKVFQKRMVPTLEAVCLPGRRCRPRCRPKKLAGRQGLLLPRHPGLPAAPGHPGRHPQVPGSAGQPAL